MKIMFFSVHAAIWVHALPENRLACELAKAGHEITYVTCARAFKGHCTSMVASGYGLDLPDERKEEVCRVCVRNADILAQGNGGRHLTLADHLTPEDEREIEDYVRSLPRESYIDAMWDGHAIGKIASYELFLIYKKMTGVLSDHEWSHYETYLKNTMRAGIGFKRMFETVRPDVVFFYSPQYAVNGICAEMASKLGATAYFVEGSANNAERYQALRIWDWTRHGLLNPALMQWPYVKDRIAVEDAARVVGHFDELFAGTSFAVYSSPRAGAFSARRHFNVPDKAKLVLVTLSSFDEALAAVVIGKYPETKIKSDVFKDQFEWIEKTFDYIKDRDDIKVVIRVHPRDYPNKREKVQSEQSLHWEALLAKHPKNVVINRPQEEVSLYDILNETDVLVTGWSATGVEAMAYGIPVVSYDRNMPYFPDDIHFTGDTRAEYFQNFERALADGRSEERAVNAFRWLAASFSLGAIRVSRSCVLDRFAAWLKFRLSAANAAKLDEALMRHQARRSIPFRQDAARFRSLVETRAPDLLDVVMKQRSAVAEGELNPGIAAQVAKVRFTGDG